MLIDVVKVCIVVLKEVDLMNIVLIFVDFVMVFVSGLDL